MSDRKEWMLGLPGHNELVKLDDVALLIRGGSLRSTDLVKKLGEPWKAAGEMPELEPVFEEADAAGQAARAAKAAAPAADTRRATVPDRASKSQAKPAESTRVSKSEVRPVPPPPKPPEAAPVKPTTQRIEAPPAKAEAPAPAKPEEKTPPPPPPKPAEKPARTERVKRDVPKAPPRVVVRIPPMVGKYYSPVDLLRSASLAFEPKKLLIALAVAVPLAIAGSLGMAPREEGPAAIILPLLALLILLFGLAFILTALAYVTRRQLEGEPYTLSEVIHWVGSNVVTAVVYPAVLAPSGIAFAGLWALGLLRNRGTGGASFLKIAYFIPMLLSFVALLGIFVFQLGSMYIPAAGAVEGAGMSGTLRFAWNHVRRQWGRVVLHWLIVTVACGVITFVCLGIAALAVELPQFVFGPPPVNDPAIGEAWNNFAPLFLVYRGIAFGLGLVLPVSLLSTLGCLSYLAMRHPASAALSAEGGMDETSGGMVGAGRGSSGLLEATQPAETRPAPDSTSHGSRPGMTPIQGVSEDKGEGAL